MTTPTLAPMLAVSEYARRVRDQLADLTADEVTELTEGMEADLVEALLETPGADEDALPNLEQVEAHFGPPADYAAELRAAAGLPGPAAGRGATGRRSVLARADRRAEDARRRLRSWLDAQPWWPGARDLALAMRPVWWVLRAYVLAMIGNPWHAGPVPASTARWLALFVLLALSVQWGRGRLGTATWTQVLGIAASVVAVVAMPVVLAAAAEGRTVYVENFAEAPYDPGVGVLVDGHEVRSFHAYDAQGNLIEEFRLYDDRGRPVVTVPHGGEEFYVGGSDESWLASPPLDVYGQPAANTYPLRMGRWDWLEWDDVGQRWAPADGSTLAYAPAPFERAVPLAEGDRAPSSSPSDATGVTGPDDVPDDGATDDDVPDGVAGEGGADASEGGGTDTQDEGSADARDQDAADADAADEGEDA